MQLRCARGRTDEPRSAAHQPLAWSVCSSVGLIIRSRTRSPTPSHARTMSTAGAASSAVPSGIHAHSGAAASRAQPSAPAAAGGLSQAAAAAPSGRSHKGASSSASSKPRKASSSKADKAASGAAAAAASAKTKTKKSAAAPAARGPTRRQLSLAANKSTSHAIPGASFARLVREIAQDVSFDKGTQFKFR